MGYNLTVLGCGTMGVAILSGVLKSLETRLSAPLKSNLDGAREPPSGLSTPTASQFLDAPDDVLPSKFITTVGREETVRKLSKVFKAMGRLGEAVEVRGGQGVNVQAVEEADVVLVWYVTPSSLIDIVECGHSLTDELKA
jgi:pyrroline-5-carboxylate reductase